MSYVQRVLQPGETLIYATKLHWLVYARAVGLLIIAAALAALAEQTGTDLRMLVWAGAGALGAAGIIAGLVAALRRVTTELAVTDHRVIYKRGIIGRYTIEMARSKVESVDVVQSLTGRVLNYGTILVRGTGGTLEPFRNVEDPLRLRSAIIAQ
jgi:uncharacterized membrane protein YdbT with pleckstrin-like domain